MVGRELRKIGPNGEDHPGPVRGGETKGAPGIDIRRMMIDLKN